MTMFTQFLNDTIGGSLPEGECGSVRQPTQLDVETQLSLGKDDQVGDMQGGCYSYVVLQ